MKGFRVFVFVSLLLALFFSAGISAEKLTVHFIDVGQGDSILIESQETNVLIDGGDRWSWVEEILISYLEDRGIVTLDAIISTHPHSDHIGGLPAVIKNFEVEKIYDSGRVHTTQTYENYLQVIFDKGIPFATPRRNEQILIGDLNFLVFNPGENVEDYSLNDASIVLRLEFGEVSFLFTGDAEEGAEREMVEKGLPLNSTILKVGHHGSRTSTNSFFLEQVVPEVAIIQVGADNRYGHPHQEVLDRLESKDIKVLRNDLHGNIVIGTDGFDYWVKTEMDKRDEKPLININKADPLQLEELPGIGPVLAERIVEYRENHGDFKSLQEIKNVEGIGQATFQEIKELLVLE